MKFLKNKKGLSIVELLVVISIFTIMAALSTTTYKNWQKQVQLVNGSSELREILLQAHQLSTAAAENSSWGVHLDQDSYSLFKGSFYNQADPENKDRDFYGIYIKNVSTSISDGLGAYSNDIVFEKYTGETANTGSIYLRTKFGNDEKIIVVESSGRINYE